MLVHPEFFFTILSFMLKMTLGYLLRSYIFRIHSYSKIPISTDIWLSNISNTRYLILKSVL